MGKNCKSEKETIRVKQYKEGEGKASYFCAKVTNYCIKHQDRWSNSPKIHYILVSSRSQV